MRKNGIAQDFQELGRYKLRTRVTGVIDNDAVDEQDALDQIKRFLSYLPSDVWGMPPRTEVSDDPERREDELTSIIPRDGRKPYDMRRILGLVLD